MKVDIKRNSVVQSYEVPGSNRTINVMQVLDYIYEKLDHSLAYYRHSACCQGICGRCVVKVDGKNTLACTAKVEPDAEKVLLEPAGKNVIRDLVIGI
jgi:succinate dehydrogenase/fumarate reductase-like Fe-S protein